MTDAKTLAAELRTAADNIRKKATPLDAFIPLLQRAADALDLASQAPAAAVTHPVAAEVDEVELIADHIEKNWKFTEREPWEIAKDIRTLALRRRWMRSN